MSLKFTPNTGYFWEISHISQDQYLAQIQLILNLGAIYCSMENNRVKKHQPVLSDRLLPRFKINLSFPMQIHEIFVTYKNKLSFYFFCKTTKFS